MLDDEPCPLCHKLMTLGKALFTAGCTHTFHYMCIQEVFIRGQKLCPVCESTFDEPPVLLTDRTISADWYFGAINREQAEMLLLQANEEGTFLVRDSAQNNGQYCVSFLNDKVRHCRVYLNERGAFYLTTNRHSFNTIGELIEYYKSSYLTHAAGEDGVQPTLFKFTKPCPERFKALLNNPNARPGSSGANPSIPTQTVYHPSTSTPTPPGRANATTANRANISAQNSSTQPNPSRLEGSQPNSYDDRPADEPTITTRRQIGLSPGINNGTNTCTDTSHNEPGVRINRSTTQPALSMERAEALRRVGTAGSPGITRASGTGNTGYTSPTTVPRLVAGHSNYQNTATASNSSDSTAELRYANQDPHGGSLRGGVTTEARIPGSMENVLSANSSQLGGAGGNGYYGNGSPRGVSEAERDRGEGGGRPYLNSANILRTQGYNQANATTPNSRNTQSDVR